MFSKELKCLLLIIIIFIAACIETDIYLPAFIDMMAFFAISEEKIQSLLSWNFIGICLSGPFYGPISDAIGRKKPLILALTLFLLGSILTVFTNDFTMLLLGRVLQGLGSGGCFTLGTAIIFDSFKGEKAVDALNRINSIVPFIMAAAPMLGGYLNSHYGFRSNFVAIALAVLLSLLTCLFFFDETLPVEKRVPLEGKKVANDFKKVSLSLPFWQTTLIVSLIFAGYLAFLSTMSVLFVLELGVSKEQLPYFQAALLGAWLLANLFSKRVLASFGGDKVKLLGIVLLSLGGVGLVACSYLTDQNVYWLTFFMALYSFGANWVQGLYFPEGMELFPENKGVAASLLSSSRLLITACVVAIASALYDGTIYPIVAIIFAIVCAMVITIFFYEKRKAAAARVYG